MKNDFAAIKKRIIIQKESGTHSELKNLVEFDFCVYFVETDFSPHLPNEICLLC